MIPRVRRALQQHRLAEPGEPLWVAVSGGMDSMVLLHVLHALGHPCHVVHVDHGLRGAESDMDRELVRQVSAGLGLPCRVDHVDVQAHMVGGGVSLQMAARELRYRVFQACVAEGPSKLALAHHADDSVETFFLALARGMGSRGWGTIPPASGPFIRPLIGVEREAIEGYAQEHGILYREDASNRDPKYSRNRVRHELLPRLDEMRPGMQRVLRRQVVLLRELEAAARAHIQETIGQWQEDSSGTVRVPLDAIRASHQPRLLLHGLIGADGFHPDDLERILNAVWDGATGRRFIRGGRQVLIDREEMVIGLVEVPEAGWRIDTPDAVPEEAPMSIESRPSGEADTSEGPQVAWFNEASLTFPLILRPWRAGDRMRPLGLDGSKLVSDLLTDARVPAQEKRRAMVLESAGRIVWLCGHRLGEEARLREGPLLRVVFLR